MIGLKTRFLFLITLVAVIFTSCEKGGNYVTLDNVPARIYVIAHVYNPVQGTDATAWANISNVGVYEFPQEIDEGMPWVVTAEYRDLTAADTLRLPRVKRGEIAYCHVNLFLCAPGQSVMAQVETLSETTEYPENAKGYDYKDFLWMENPTQNLFYMSQTIDLLLQDRVQDITYGPDVDWVSYTRMIAKLSADHPLELESMMFWGSGWSLNRIARTSRTQQIHYTLQDALSGEALLSFNLIESDALVVYGTEEVPHPQYADFYVKGLGYNQSNAITGMFDVPDRAGGGIFYDD